MPAEFPRPYAALVMGYSTHGANTPRLSVVDLRLVAPALRALLSLREEQFDLSRDLQRAVRLAGYGGYLPSNVELSISLPPDAIVCAGYADAPLVEWFSGFDEFITASWASWSPIGLPDGSPSSVLDYLLRETAVDDFCLPFMAPQRLPILSSGWRSVGSMTLLSDGECIALSQEPSGRVVDLTVLAFTIDASPDDAAAWMTPAEEPESEG